MKGKKAFEIQFNWLFVLFAGAAILMFFTSITLKQKDVSETTSKATVLKSVDSLVTGISVSKDTSNIIKVPNSKIEFSCNKISIGGIPKIYQNLILFAPSSLSGDRLLTQTLTFSVPFRTTNMLYLTNPKTRYIIIGEGELVKEINDTLPAEIRKEFYDENEIAMIKNENSQKVRIIFLSTPGNSVATIFKDMNDEDVTALEINENENQLKFYQKKSSQFVQKGTSSYASIPLLLGAIYSDTKDNYECNANNILKKTNLVTKLYKDRTSELKELLTVQQFECNGRYAEAIALFTSIETASGTGIISKESFMQMLSASESLSEINNELQGLSCPVVY